MSENSIKSIMDVTMDKLRAMVDANTIIGDPIVVAMLPCCRFQRSPSGLRPAAAIFRARPNRGFSAAAAARGLQ